MILLVASHPETREKLVPLISSRNYPVMVIDCGRELLARLRFQPPALLIIDCDVSDSFEMLDVTRREAHATNLPVIMFSESGAKVRERALGKGASAFVAKGSLDWADLLDQIERFLGPPPAPVDRRTV